jgi:hypothetical protein
MVPAYHRRDAAHPDGDRSLPPSSAINAVISEYTAFQQHFYPSFLKKSASENKAKAHSKKRALTITYYIMAQR